MLIIELQAMLSPCREHVGVTAQAMICTDTRLHFAAIVAIGISTPVLGDVQEVTTGSMKPTMLVGDLLVSVPLTFAELRRGDIVTFRHPRNTSVFVKRLIGLPGDIVQIKGGVLFLNGKEAPQTSDGTFDETFQPQGPMGEYPRCENRPAGKGDLCKASRLIETLPPVEGFPEGRAHYVLNVEQSGVADNTGIFTVPEGYFFVLGDNRDNSLDSRFSQVHGGMGFIPAENLIGRVDQVLSSRSGAPSRSVQEVK